MATVLAGTLAASRTEAQALYYRSIPIGERAMGLGGAYTGIANDPSATYYNPAGMMNGGRFQLLGSLASLVFTRRTVEGAFDSPNIETDFVSKKSTTLPRFIGTVVACQVLYQHRGLENPRQGDSAIAHELAIPSGFSFANALDIHFVNAIYFFYRIANHGNDFICPRAMGRRQLDVEMHIIVCDIDFTNKSEFHHAVVEFRVHYVFERIHYHVFGNRHSHHLFSKSVLTV